MAKADPAIVEPVEPVEVPKTRLELVEDAIAVKGARLVQAESDVGRLVDVERAAVARDLAADPGTEPYFKGRDAWRARDDRRKAEQSIADLSTELRVLGEERQQLTAHLAAERLAEAIEHVTPLHEAMASAVTDAAELLAQLIRGPWQAYRDALDELVLVTPTGEAIAAEALATVPDSARQWAQAISSSLEPLPTNVGFFIEAILLAAFDRGGTTTAGIPHRGLVGLVPDLTGEDLFAAHGRMSQFGLSATVGHALDSGLRRLDRRQAAEATVAKSERQLEVEAERAREIEDLFWRAGGPKTMPPVPEAEHRWGVEPSPEPMLKPAAIARRDAELDGPLSDAERLAFAQAEIEDGV
jgi:hypothetical protein